MCHQPSRHTSSRIPPHLLNVSAALHMNKNVPLKQQQKMKSMGSLLFAVSCAAASSRPLCTSLCPSLCHVSLNIFSPLSLCVCVCLCLCPSCPCPHSFFFLCTCAYVHNVVICPVRTGPSLSPLYPQLFVTQLCPHFTTSTTTAAATTNYSRITILFERKGG